MSQRDGRRTGPMHYTTQVRFTDAQRDVLALLAGERGNVSDVIRSALDAYADRFVDPATGRTMREAAEQGELSELGADWEFNRTRPDLANPLLDDTQ